MFKTKILISLSILAIFMTSNANPGNYDSLSYNTEQCVKALKTQNHNFHKAKNTLGLGIGFMGTFLSGFIGLGFLLTGNLFQAGACTAAGVGSSYMMYKSYKNLANKNHLRETKDIISQLLDNRFEYITLLNPNTITISFEKQEIRNDYLKHIGANSVRYNLQEFQS